ncbi:unnamed protein product [Brassica rapa subsp. trilocularis]
MRFSIPRVRRSFPRPFESLRAGKQEEADRAKASPLLASALPERSNGTRLKGEAFLGCGFRVKLAHCQKTNRSSYLDQRTLIPGALATRLKRRGISYSSTCLEKNESISKRRGRKHDSGAEPYDARV